MALPIDLQKPPRTLPLNSQRLAAIVPGDIPKWRMRWKRVLFGKAAPPKRNPRLVIINKSLPEASNGIERMRVTYRVDAHTTVEAFILQPRYHKPRRLPGVVFLHQTYPKSNPWKRAASLNTKGAINIAARLARRNYIVIVPRCFIFSGQRSRGKHPWNFAHKVREMKKHHPGWTGIGRMILDGIRAVDVLRSWPGVDKRRIGAFGHSLGAKQVLFLMAFDKRLKAGISSDGGLGISYSDWRKPWYLGANIPDDTFETTQILAMIAPRAFLLLGGTNDNHRAWPFIAAAMPVWKATSHIEKIGWYHHASGHCLPQGAKRASYLFLRRHL
jgi:dienelactone hydrolase